ncbi:glycerophosphodiester phosphodiesterase [Mariniblastus fucicola]|uniref:Putative glycerophosphoryl diester phosphodiesterase 1 n=1 Tax=Mariniblastus fucicola TaxID=980251 RepID=A0A5B9PI88_9BACT|nr:glycerophosphodiester phosphodiesterase [Mariniblastus fucicola]QEG22343.1 putative glycerophosphoryl diester phosphodiesterase 1 [Mariniblastus fucicola]
MKLSRLPLPLVFLLISILPGLAPAQLFVAHRGASHDAPENTLAAFRLAWKQGADAIEGDFHLTSDKQIVCIHDKDTERVCPTKPVLKVAESDLATLQNLEVGSWKGRQFSSEKIPTLSDVLATVPEGKKIFVEIKCGPEILPVLEKELAASNLEPEQIVIICFKSAVIQQVRESMPQYKANWLTSYKLKGSEDDPSWTPTQDEVLATLARTQATGLGSQGHEDVVTEEFVAAMVDAGFEFHAWTIDDPNQAVQLKSFGTSSLTTNRPEFLRQQLADPKLAAPKPTTESPRELLVK